MKKVWNLKDIDIKKAEVYQKKFRVSPMLSKLLVARKIEEEDIPCFLRPDLDKLNDPFLLNDMEKLVDRILKAKDNNENVVIYGDYDVDGITSITVIYSFLKDLGMKVSYYLPDRLEEGYGLNNNAIKMLKENGADLVVTVDCGISANDIVEYAKDIGLDICITDHHECTENIPKAIAVVNPKRLDSTYPFSTLAGVGVAFKVINALAVKLSMPEESYLKYLDLVCVGTIADIVPLLGENRIITYNGLRALNKTKNEGLKALIKVAKLEKIDSEAVSFGLAPRINACGRMADASVAVKLLLATNTLEATSLANVLDEQNKKRQEVEKKILQEAVCEITEKNMESQNTIVLASPTWHPGVIGIVASKLAEKYLKPVVLLSIDGIEARGSGRIPQGLSLYTAVSRCQDLLLNYGGHELAAGLSIKKENIQEFAKAFEAVITEMKTSEFVSIIDVDMELGIKDVTFELANDVARLAPFGQQNKMPVFRINRVKVTSVCTLKENKHLKLTVLADGPGGNFAIEALGFCMGHKRDEITVGDRIDLVCTLSVNAFMGNIKMQLIMQDFAKSIN